LPELPLSFLANASIKSVRVQESGGAFLTVILKEVRISTYGKNEILPGAQKDVSPRRLILQ
jgi:hypothetical protein